MKKINYLHIIIHFAASWFFIFSFQTFFLFTSSDLIKKVYSTGIENALQNTDVITMSNFTFWTNISAIIGIFVAFMISIVISLKQRWSILNCVIVLTLSLVLNKFNLLGKSFVKRIINPGYSINNTELIYLSFSILLLIIGLVIFLSKKTNNTIKNQHFKQTH